MYNVDTGCAIASTSSNIHNADDENRNSRAVGTAQKRKRGTDSTDEARHRGFIYNKYTGVDHLEVVGQTEEQLNSLVGGRNIPSAIRFQDLYDKHIRATESIRQYMTSLADLQGSTVSRLCILSLDVQSLSRLVVVQQQQLAVMQEHIQSISRIVQPSGRGSTEC
jgi:hypothetical protein